jgi:hypothetical protein
MKNQILSDSIFKFITYFEIFSFSFVQSLKRTMRIGTKGVGVESLSFIELCFVKENICENFNGSSISLEYNRESQFITKI